MPWVGACIDYRTAEECQDIGTCPLPDAGVIVVQDAPPPCAGQCVPLAYADWNGPFLVWLGPEPQRPSGCPDQASFSYGGVAAPTPPVCGACTCQPSTGACALPATVTAHADQCPGTGSGIAFDPSSVWDGSCTAPGAITGGVESVAVAPLRVNESCAPVVQVPLEPSHPHTLALGCGSTAIGTCPEHGDVCLPAAQNWRYCISHDGAGDAYTAQCPKGSPYSEINVFADDFIQPACSPCTCGSPVGSACGASLVSFYADGACSEQIASVTAQSSASMCVDIPATSPMGSMTASPPAYSSGTCTPSGGALTGTPIPIAPLTFCCLPQHTVP